MSSYLTSLSCDECGTHVPADRLQTFCPDCNAPWFANYDLTETARVFPRDVVAERTPGIWRWSELLPVQSHLHRITLGEGETPLLLTHRLADSLRLSSLWIKDESFNPTASFKARGLVMAVARARELGATRLIIPTAGNAGGALAAYAARTGMTACVVMPEATPDANYLECVAYGAEVIRVPGNISDAARKVAELKTSGDWFDVSTFKEPYRVEGKKTMGYELALQFGWDLPEVIIYPTGGGTGLVAMWRAFAELAQLGWLDTDQMPRMVVVQADGCAPVVRAWQAGADHCEFWQDAQTIASGLRVPKSFADRAILRTLKESKGCAVAVSDADIRVAQTELAQAEGIFAAPEGAATLAALKALKTQGWVEPSQRIVLFNTSTGLKYLDSYQQV